MATHAERRVLPYTPEQLFDLVAAIDRYPEFLPWCVAARIRERQDSVLIGDLVIGFKMIRERFTSKVTLDRATRIDVEYLSGPMHYLNNHWTFTPAPSSPELPGGGTVIDFYVDFEFRSRLLQSLIGVLFHEAVKRMVAAFEGRARQLYGAPAEAPASPRPA
jgi:coenzyme Q-binding protein COQ10